VQCSVCGLWIHKACANISDDGFKFLEEQVKNTGTAFWACRACTAYANGMNHRMREIEAKLDEVKETCGQNAEGLRKVQDEVGKLTQTVVNQSKKIEEAAAAGASCESVFDELRERELKKHNVVMHGMGEAPDEVEGRDRWDWDMKSCENLFRALQVGLTAENVKFCRRLGERGGHPRPMVVGLHDERDKAKLLRCDTRRTTFSDVDIGPDLTQKQRQEEANMRTEAVRRNREISAEDRAKNLAWTVVGPRGERRLVKRIINMELEMRGGRQRRQVGGAAAPARPANPPTSSIRRGVPPPAAEGADSSEEMEEVTVTQERPRAGRTNRLTSTKRKEREEEVGAEALPPAKH
jgi:hypothetical protein